MIDVVVLSDTHGRDGRELAGRAREAVGDADRLLHAGDFTTEPVLDAFHGAGPRLDAVHGNSDAAAVRERLPAARVVELEGVRVAITHRRRGGRTGLTMFGRERGADLVVSGHTHRPSFVDGDPALLDPGSHAEPRGGPATHAELRVVEGDFRGAIRDRGGAAVEEFRASAGPG